MTMLSQMDLITEEAQSSSLMQRHQTSQEQTPI
jgi:hypothetical protein